MRRRDVYLAVGTAVAVAGAFALWAESVSVRLENLEGGIEASYHDVIGRLDDLAGEDRNR